jgi:hypothetical protein
LFFWRWMKKAFARLKTTTLHERLLLRDPEDDSLKKFIREKLQECMSQSGRFGV